MLQEQAVTVPAGFPRGRCHPPPPPHQEQSRQELMFSQHLAVRTPSDSLISCHTDKRSGGAQSAAGSCRASDPVAGQIDSKA